MKWHYAGKNDEPIGPLSESEMTELAERGEINASTLVWNDTMPDWLALGQTSLADGTRAVPPPIRRPEPSSSPATSGPMASASFERDPNKVYPSNPPRSPHMCWLNILLPGGAQMVLGQTGKGFALLLSFIGLMASVALSPFSLGVLIFSVVDAYKVGVLLRDGHAVDKWAFMPGKVDV